MAWLEQAIKENRVPTTYEMDEVDPTDPDAFTVMIMCNNGHWNEWKNYESGMDRRINCQIEECDTRMYIGSTLISKRTWNPEKKVGQRGKRSA